MKRQRGRNRGGGGGGKPQHNTNRAFESNGPDGVKARGNAQTVFEKYQQLARDAASGGDRVLAENYLQHAEHYFRTLRAMQPQRTPSDIIGRDQFSSGLDIDFEAEPEEAADNTPGEAADNDGEGQRDDRDDRRDRHEGRDRQRDDRPRDDRPRDDRPRDDRQQGEGREGGGGRRRDRWRDREGRERFDRGDQQREAPAEAPPAPQPATEPVKASPVLRSASGDVSHAPAFLGRSAPEPRVESDEAPVAKPRRTRKPKAAATADEG